ncbi:hypothetical protein [Paenibacillus sp. FSL H7-0714]|uniref:hypothetical protein n=1 Tax=Paenibacillus sp. FSL H7-0714 TaxID=2954735 RepID=UPI0030FBCC15
MRSTEVRRSIGIESIRFAVGPDPTAGDASRGILRWCVGWSMISALGLLSN